MAINKQELFFKCEKAINKRIEKYEKEMEMIKESMDANDVKTDYDEDNKGELLGDFEKYAAYLSEARDMKKELAKVDPELSSETVDFGSVVETDDNYYFIAVSLGEIVMDNGSTVFTISTKAPIFEHFQRKKAGESFIFNNKEFNVVSVE